MDRQTYASFIQYFTLLFLENPTDSKNHCMGEASLLLRIKIHIAQDPEQKVSIKKLLALTTANLQGRMLLIDDMEIELSLGLVDLLNEYTGDKSLERQQKLFPNLTEDLLEDLFHKAAQKLLPPGSIAALPEAFLIFPHPFKRMRILAKLRKNQQAHPQKIYHNPISRQELKRQLNDNYRPRRS